MESGANARSCPEDRERVGDGFAAVNDDGTVQLHRKRELSLEELFLNRAVGKLVEVVQAHFTKRDDRWIALKLAKCFDIGKLRLVGVVRMNADRAADVVSTFAQFDG